MYDTFIVTDYDPATRHGYAEHTASTLGLPLHTERIRFDVGIGKGTCEYGYDEFDGWVIRIPNQQIAERVPEVGTVIMGAIACEPHDNALVIGEDGLPFLRNWFYKDQHDEAIAKDNGAHSVEDDGNYFPQTDPDDFADEEAPALPEHDEVVTMAEVLARAHRAYPEDPELASNLARTCPGDFI